MEDTAPAYDFKGYQEKLVLLGYDIGKEPDGVWDNASLLALKEFQKKVGIPRSGHPDELTDPAVEKAVAEVKPKAQSHDHDAIVMDDTSTPVPSEGHPFMVEAPDERPSLPADADPFDLSGSRRGDRHGGRRNR